jgi:drug/metabolite transporter (DMT)-like permease
MLSAGAALVVLSAATGDYRHADLHAAGPSITALGYLIVFGCVLAYSTYEWLVHNAPARIVGTYAFVNPVVAVALGWLFLDEQVGVRTGLAAATIAVGVAFIVTQKNGPGADDQVSDTSRVGRSPRCTSSGSPAGR